MRAAPSSRRGEEVVVDAAIGFGCWRGEPRAMPAAHRHHDVELNYVERGGACLLHGGALRELRAGQLALLWASVPHRLLRVEPDTRFGWVTLPLVWVLRSRAGRALGAPLLAGRLVGGEVDTVRPETFARWNQDLHDRHSAPPGGGMGTAEAFLLELEGALVRLASLPTDVAAAAGTTRPTASGPLERFEAMARHVGENYRERLTLTDVARAAGLHPNYASGLFRRHAGVGLGEYLTRQRVSHAQRLLLTGDAKILDVALASGFTSLSRFYAAFTAVCGQSPRAFRQAYRLPGG